MPSIEIRFGALAYPIDKQLKRQGYRLDPAFSRQLQMDVDAVTRLRVQGLLSDAAHNRIAKRITQQILKNATPLRRNKEG